MAASAASPAANAKPPSGDAMTMRRLVHQVPRACTARWRATSARACAINRASKSGASTSGARSGCAIRSANSSSREFFSMSRMVHSFQQHAKPFAGSTHPHLERRYTDTRQLRHRFVIHLFHVFQHERLSLFHWQAIERSLNLILRLFARSEVGLLGGRDRFDDEVIVDEPAVSLLPPLRERP